MSKAIKRYREPYEKTCKEFFIIMNNNFEQNVKWHEELDTPIFVVYSDKYDSPNLIINPSLKDMGFQKIFDPYTCFQEIDMFLSGIMQSPEKKMVNLTDKDMRDKKGFNDMSFKKEKWKHL